MTGAFDFTTCHRLATRPRAVDVASLARSTERRIVALAEKRRLRRATVVVLHAADARRERGLVRTERAVPTTSLGARIVGRSEDHESRCERGHENCAELRHLETPLSSLGWVEPSTHNRYDYAAKLTHVNSLLNSLCALLMRTSPYEAL